MGVGKGNIERLKAGDSPWTGPLNSRIWNEVVETVKAVRGIGGRGLMTQGGGYDARSLAMGKTATIGVIDDSDRSTDDEWPDLSRDNRYWVRVWTQTARAASSPAAVDAIANLNTGTASSSFIVPATNLAERKPADDDGGSHLLRNGTLVLCWEVQVGANRHWVFWHPVRDRFPAMIDGSNGRAHSWHELIVSTAGEMISDDDGLSGTVSDGAAYEFNYRRSVPSGTIVWVEALWDFVNDVPTYWFDLAMGNDQSGTSQSPDRAILTYGSAHGEEVRSNPNDPEEWWHVEKQKQIQGTATGAERGVKLSVVTGSAYYDTGDAIWYEHRVDLEFDANGHLWSIGAEYRVTVAEPEECPTP